ncbi:hypothetical protein WJX73_010379 [Symbiochloris irregularis]|uniref:Uncharacterized protein n=1 Tax=Symbiochloris irregularis TaxID=706552 RepID=A0AAW1NND2_9CHLO
MRAKRQEELEAMRQQAVEMLDENKAMRAHISRLEAEQASIVPHADRPVTPQYQEPVYVHTHRPAPQRMSHAKWLEFLPVLAAQAGWSEADIKRSAANYCRNDQSSEGEMEDDQQRMQQAGPHHLHESSQPTMMRHGFSHPREAGHAMSGSTAFSRPLAHVYPA